MAFPFTGSKSDHSSRNGTFENAYLPLSGLCPTRVSGHSRRSFLCFATASFSEDCQIPQSEPPAPRRAFPGHPTIEHVTLVHATTVGGLKGIFNSGKISPSILHDPDSMSFFALGARRTGDPKWDSQELTRILHNGWHASKNACNVLLVAVGWGTGENIDVGGEHP